MGEQAAKSGFIDKILHSLAAVMTCPGMTFPSQFSLTVAHLRAAFLFFFNQDPSLSQKLKHPRDGKRAWKVCLKRCPITVCIYSPHCKCWSPGKQVSTGQGLGEGEEAPAQPWGGAEPWGAPSPWHSGAWLIFCELGRLLFWNAGVHCIHPCNSQRRDSHLQ